MSFVIPALRGSVTGHFASRFSADETILRQGENVVDVVLCQIAQVYYAFLQTSLALNAAGVSASISWPFHCVCFLSPIIVSALREVLGDRHTLRDVNCFIHDNIGNLCYIATFVSSVALIIFGQVALGGASAFFLIFGILKDKGLLPQVVHSALHSPLFIIINIAGLIVSGGFTKFLAACDLISFVWEKFENLQTKEEKELEIVSVNDVKSQVLKTSGYCVSRAFDLNEKHLQVVSSIKDIPPPPPNVELDSLNQMFESISWEGETLKVLETALSKDNKWKKRTDKKGGEVEYIRKGISQWIERIKGGRIFPYQSERREMLNSYLLHIVDILSQKSEKDKVSTLIGLGIDSYYCPDDQLKAAFEWYHYVNADLEVYSLQGKLLRILEQSRRQILDSILYNSFKWARFIPILRDFYDSSELHFYNSIMNVWGEEFGLSYVHIAKEDEIYRIAKIERIFLSLLLFPLKWRFWREYNVLSIKQRIDEAINGFPRPDNPQQRINRIISLSDTYEWLKDNKLISEDVDGIFDEDGKLRDQYISLLLVNMGILKLKENES